MKKIFNLINLYKDYILYVIFGVATTLVNIISYVILDYLSLGTVTSTSLSWFVSVLFAYVTNKLFVFHIQDKDKKHFFNKIIDFYGCRLATGLMDLLIMYVFVDLLNMNNLVIKCLSNIIVIILNFVFSKYLIFKKNNNETPQRL